MVGHAKGPTEIVMIKDIPKELTKKELIDLKYSTLSNLIKTRRKIFEVNKEKMKRWHLYTDKLKEEQNLQRKLTSQQDNLVQIDDESK